MSVVIYLREPIIDSSTTLVGESAQIRSKFVILKTLEHPHRHGEGLAIIRHENIKVIIADQISEIKFEADQNGRIN